MSNISPPTDAATGMAAADFLPDWAAHVSAVSDRATVEFARATERVVRHGQDWNRHAFLLALQPLKAAAAWSAAPFHVNPFDALRLAHDMQAAWLTLMSISMAPLNQTPPATQAAAE